MKALNETNEAISHLANAYLKLSAVRAELEIGTIQLLASTALVHISKAQEQAFEIRVVLEAENGN